MNYEKAWFELIAEIERLHEMTDDALFYSPYKDNSRLIDQLEVYDILKGEIEFIENTYLKDVKDK